MSYPSQNYFSDQIPIGGYPQHFNGQLDQNNFQQAGQLPDWEQYDSVDQANVPIQHQEQINQFQYQMTIQMQQMMNDHNNQMYNLNDQPQPQPVKVKSKLTLNSKAFEKQFEPKAQDFPAMTDGQPLDINKFNPPQPKQQSQQIPMQQQQHIHNNLFIQQFPQQQIPVHQQQYQQQQFQQFHQQRQMEYNQNEQFMVQNQNYQQGAQFGQPLPQNFYSNQQQFNQGCNQQFGNRPPLQFPQQQQQQDENNEVIWGIENKISKPSVKGPAFESAEQQEQQKLKAEKKAKANLPSQPPKDKKFKRLDMLAEDIKLKIPKQMITETDLTQLVIDESKFFTVDESRLPINLVMIGHVDAGKSTICGSILLLTDRVKQEDLRKFEQEAKEKHRDTWYLAYIMDINEEERNKGKTVEVGKAFFQTQHKRFTLLDAPGHKNYVPNMLAGAAQSDVAALIISAKPGEFEAGFDKGGQTREHAMLVRSLGVKRLVVIVNKMDECGWSQKRYEQIQNELAPFLKNSCGFDIEKEIDWVPISGQFQENMLVPVDIQKCPWYKGPTLFELFDRLPAPNRNPNTDLRIPVLDKFKDQGLHIFGKIESGSIKIGQQVTMMPLQSDFTITEIYNSEDNKVQYAKAGENVKMKVKGLKEVDVQRGMMICNNDDFCQVCYEIETELRVLELPEHKQIMSIGYQAVLHMHTIMEEVVVTKVTKVSDVDKKVELPKQTFLLKNMKGTVSFKCRNYMCLEKYEKNEFLGSFTLRDEGMTIAVGKILRVKPIKVVSMQQNMADSLQLKKMQVESAQKEKEEQKLQKEADQKLTVSPTQQAQNQKTEPEVD